MPKIKTIKCVVCGREVWLGHFTNTCECGADYNMSGDKLVPRSLWGEETGETASDILLADADYEREKWEDEFN